MNGYRMIALGLVLAVGGLGACVPEVTLPEDCGEGHVEREVTLANDRITPGQIEVCDGQHVVLRVTVQQAAIFHLHGYDSEAPARDVVAGNVEEFVLMARAGEYPIELHLAGGEQVEAGVLTVHLP
ncbi:MAG TPA: hypothetical protein VJA85_08115 [Candidatus Limnocylindria bacterium]|nr:hypothetical protein [Candidatus Limnocylindria bacterium]